MNDYKVVPFRAQVSSDSDAELIAQQLQDLIESESKPNWSFVEVCEVSATVSPGCLGILLGRKKNIVKYDLVIFKAI